LDPKEGHKIKRGLWKKEQRVQYFRNAVCGGRSEKGGGNPTGRQSLGVLGGEGKRMGSTWFPRGGEEEKGPGNVVTAWGWRFGSIRKTG